MILIKYKNHPLNKESPFNKEYTLLLKQIFPGVPFQQLSFSFLQISEHDCREQGWLSESPFSSCVTARSGCLNAYSICGVTTFTDSAHSAPKPPFHYNPSGWVLELVEKFVGKTNEDGITIVNTRHSQGMNENSSAVRSGQRLWRDGKEVTLSHNSSRPMTRAGGQGHSRSGAVFKQAEMACGCLFYYLILTESVPKLQKQ